MPLYEYECSSCKELIELLIRGEEKPVCPDCGSLELTKLLSVPAAHTASSNSAPGNCAPPSPSGCGLPACGTGGCQGMF